MMLGLRPFRILLVPRILSTNELFATQEPTDVFNDRLKRLRQESLAAENTYQKAHAISNEAGMKAADRRAQRAEGVIGRLMEFKAGLSRFGRTYAYIAQLIDLGDPDLENFAAFTKLLAKRMHGITPENVDLAGLVLTGYKEREVEGRCS